MAAWDGYLRRPGNTGLRLVIAGAGPLQDELAAWARPGLRSTCSGEVGGGQCAELMSRARASLSRPPGRKRSGWSLSRPWPWRRPRSRPGTARCLSCQPRNRWRAVPARRPASARAAIADADAHPGAIRDVRRSRPQDLRAAVRPGRSLEYLLEIYRFAVATRPGGPAGPRNSPGPSRPPRRSRRRIRSRKGPGISVELFRAARRSMTGTAVLAVSTAVAAVGEGGGRGGAGGPDAPPPRHRPRPAPVPRHCPHPCPPGSAATGPGLPVRLQRPGSGFRLAVRPACLRTAKPARTSRTTPPGSSCARGQHSYASYQLSPDTVYYLLPGTHVGTSRPTGRRFRRRMVRRYAPVSFRRLLGISLSH